MSEAEIEKEVVWKRSEEIFTKAPTLFSGGVEPGDISQGQLGDCWLMSAIAGLAEFPGAIQKCFITKEYHPLGKYTVKLFDKPSNKWRHITVDDGFPCNRKTGNPIYAVPQGNELWVLILEKAFAKFCGSYELLAGGHTLWGLEALTGDNVWRFKAEANNGAAWKRFDMVHLDPNQKGRTKRSIGLRETTEVQSREELFKILRKYDKRQAVLSAGTYGNDDSESVQGIVQGHAYSILRVKKSGDFMMIMLRNPWGTGEWTGAWSDNSDMWEKYPQVKRDCKVVNAEDDGIFWMDFFDFCKFFQSIDVCDRSTGFEDLALDIREDDGCGGACKGCSMGCAKYWFCCKGCKAMCCGHQSREKTLSTESFLS